MATAQVRRSGCAFRFRRYLFVPQWGNKRRIGRCSNHIVAKFRQRLLLDITFLESIGNGFQRR